MCGPIALITTHQNHCLTLSWRSIVGSMMLMMKAPLRSLIFSSNLINHYKVSHHPMTVACHCDGNGWKFWGDSTLKSKFWGRSIQLDPIGILTLEFDDGEIFQWSKVTTSIYNLILGKLYCDHYGTMRIEGNRDFSCKIKFKEQSIIDKNPHQVQGVVEDK
ncbi:oxysterol-binding protein-related protein 1B-like [Arachis hypogaea]|uniref:oxysterol-binding protein-related protein 1B-like n=1 Tax=Arachis hypogaea TaxID=3818 RepID=UPI003B2218A9